MSICEQCGKETKVVFVCPMCKGKYCQEHRSIKTHICRKKKINEKKQKRNNKKDKGNKSNNKIIFILIIIMFISIYISITSGLIDLNLENTEYEILQEDYEELNQKYDELKKEYQILNNDLIEYKSLYNSTKDILKNKLLQSINTNNSISEEGYNMLFKEYENIQKNYTLLEENYQKTIEWKREWDQITDLDHIDIPSISDLENWLKNDPADNMTGISEYHIEHIALVISIKARENNWKIGVEKIYGEFDLNITHITLNTIITDQGLVYIYPGNNEVFWYENHNIIEVGMTYDIYLFENVPISHKIVIVQY